MKSISRTKQSNLLLGSEVSSRTRSRSVWRLRRILIYGLLHDYVNVRVCILQNPHHTGHVKSYYYTLNSLTHFWLAESVQWIFEISARDVITCRLYNNHVKVTGNHVKVKSNHVMYDRSAWFPRVIMPTSRDSCCLPSVKRQKHDFQVFVFNV